MYPYLECIIYIIQHWKYKFHFQKKSSHKTSNRTLYNPNALRPETTPFFRKFSPKKPSLPPPKMVPWQYTRTCVQIMQTCRGVIVLLRLRSQTTRRQRPRPTRPPGCTAASQTVVRGRRAPLHLHSGRIAGQGTTSRLRAVFRFFANGRHVVVVVGRCCR